MRTYQAGEDPVEAWGGETRAWVFDLIENPGYRRRLEELAGLDLTRRAGCEACLRALVIDDWDYQSLFHLGWCQSCRNASLALGMDTAHKTAVRPHRRRALVVALVAAVAIAVPIAGSRMIGGGSDSRGGVAQQVLHTTPATPGSTTPSTTPATTPGSKTPPTVSIVDPIPRSKRANGGQHALPHTT